MQLLARCVLTTLTILLCGASPAWSENSIKITELLSSRYDNLLKVQCEIQYQLDDKVKEALRNGIEMTFKIEIELMQSKPLLLDKTQSRFNREFKVKYHALSKQFVMKVTDSDIERSFPDLYSAFYYQRYFHNAPLADLSMILKDKKYYIRARARLASEQLPLPLRIKSYLSKGWRPSSGWTLWPI